MWGRGAPAAGRPRQGGAGETSPPAPAKGTSTIDAVKGTLDVKLSKAELEARANAWKPRAPEFTSGYLWKYTQQVGPARAGAVTRPGGAAEKACYADI